MLVFLKVLSLNISVSTFQFYMNQQEFSQPEREGKLGTFLWPDWHYGVLSMYGSEVALNHFAGVKQMNVVKLNELIDYPSGREEILFNQQK